MAYWGLAILESYNWSTIDWLGSQAIGANRFSSAEEFALNRKTELKEQLSRMSFRKDTDAGIGIHFTAYEYIDDYWIPELFLITSWSDASYTSPHTDGIRLTRETYHTISGEEKSLNHRNNKFRLKVKNFLQKEGNWLIFKNGDPIMFNKATGVIFDLFKEIARRNILKDSNDVNTHLDMVRRPIEVVANAQRDFCREGKRIVGGRIHDLAILPSGSFKSTGDNR